MEFIKQHFSAIDTHLSEDQYQQFLEDHLEQSISDLDIDEDIK